MTVDPWLLSVALLLLWCPRQWLRWPGKVKALSRLDPSKRSEREAQDHSLKFKEEFTKPRNWMDFVRALVGGMVLGLCFETHPDPADDVSTFVRLLPFAPLIVAVIIQTVRTNGGRLSLVAPVFFILGLSFGLLGWQAALFAFVTIWILNTVLPGAGFFLSAFAGLQMGFGYLLARASLDKIAVAVVLAVLPIGLSVLLNRPLVRLNKKRPSGGSIRVRSVRS